MTDHIKKPHATIFTAPTGYSKTHLVLDLIEKECNKQTFEIRWNGME